mgnify:CR=1 FL=1
MLAENTGKQQTEKRLSKMATMCEQYTNKIVILNIKQTTKTIKTTKDSNYLFFKFVK